MKSIYACLLDNRFAFCGCHCFLYQQNNSHSNCMCFIYTSLTGSSSVDTPDSRKSAEEFIAEMTGLITVCKVEDAFAAGL